MPRKSTGEYPPNWKETAKAVKEAAGYKCIRCGTEHNPGIHYTLTVHHLDLNPANCAWWNLAALCQRCHLTIQGKVIMERYWMFDHSDWFKPYVAAYYGVRTGHLKSTMDYFESLQLVPRELVQMNMGELLQLGLELNPGITEDDGEYDEQ